MARFGLAGVSWSGRGANLFPTPAPGEHAIGNPYPPITGAPDRPSSPGPAVQGHIGGNSGGTGDGTYGSDPRAPHTSPAPHVVQHGNGWSKRNLFGVQGFNDQLTRKDRHAFWDRGQQKTGLDGPVPSGAPNAYNDPRHRGPVAALRLVNRTVSYQKGSDHTANQDDLTRKYTWLGEQGAGWSPVYGGVPGLHQPYGSRGGWAAPIVSPVEFGQPGDGPAKVWAGPPHGLHSQTPWKGGAQFIARTLSTPQMRPVRIDRPSNSPQAGQSYSQTVLPQGASRVRPTSTGTRGNGPMQWTGRAWAGTGGGHGERQGT